MFRPGMSAPIRDFGFRHVPADIAPSGTERRRTDAEMGVRELEVLRLDLDMVAPPDAAELAEPLVDAFRGAPTSGDHLRLPQMTQLDGPGMRAAVGRVLAVDTAAAGAPDPDAAEKEARMREVLRALDSAAEHIQLRAGTSGHL
jgi:hypothetical protein